MIWATHQTTTRSPNENHLPIPALVDTKANSEMTRCLFNPNRERYTPGDGAPKGNFPAARIARQALGEFLDANLTRPLYNSAAQNDQRVERELDSMTQAERVYLEIEMQARAKVFYSFNYDALPGK